MAVDFGILAQTPSIGARYAEGLQLAQADQERNMLRAMQVQQMQAQRENMRAQKQDREAQAKLRGQQELELKSRMERAAREEGYLNKVSELFANNGMPLNLKTAQEGLSYAIKSGDKNAIDMMTKTMTALQEREALRSAFGGQAAPVAAPSMMRQPPAAAAAPTNMFAGTMADIGTAQPAPVNALAAPPQTPAAGGMSRDKLQAIIANPDAPTAVVDRAKALLATIEKPQTYTPSADMQGYELAKSEGFKGTFFDYKRQLAEAGRPPAQPREPREPPAPIAVVDDATGTVKLVPRQEAIGKTPAAAIEGLTPKERQQREAKFPQATTAVKTFDNTANTLIKDLETLANHPGLSSITGIAAGRLPGITSQGREAEALFDKIVARGGFQELQNMRQASPTGGALGNVSNAEGAQLRQAFAALDRRQDAPSVRKAVADAVAQIRASQQNVREAYDLTYEYKQRGGEVKPTPTPTQSRSGATVSNW
jgi:hypothetical protein